jgi:hypothetical protein
LANVQVALHEQSHLQDVIERAMPEARWLRRRVTSAFMDLPRPGGQRISLGRDVPGGFGGHLRGIDNRAARELLRQFGVGESTLGSASTDWSDLGQRMRFILALLRARHADPGMFSRPE